MKSVSITLKLFFLASIIFCCSGPKEADYKDSSLSAEVRTKALLAKMTPEEKVMQMVCVWNDKNTLLLDENGDLDIEKAKKNFKDGVGQVGRPSDSGGGKNAREMAELTNAIQKFFVEETRLGIPVVFHEECLHGLAAKEGTSFPQPIGLACTWDTDLVNRIFTLVAAQARSRGATQALTPVVDVARDARWGRVEETYGEDPYLVSEMGLAAVTGFQGNGDGIDNEHIMATLKHFAAHGQPESGMNCGPANVSERYLRETFFYPFKKCVQQGQVASLMASYNEIDGVPSHANKWLLKDVLRDEWGFKGYVVSDYYAITELYEREDFKQAIEETDSTLTFMPGNYLAGSLEEAALLAFNAGVNIELPEPKCYPYLLDLLKEGKITEAEIDELVAPMLEYKFRLGLFDHPYVDADKAEALAQQESNKTLAREAAQKTIVLLKNKNNVLPLDKNKPQTIAIIGPNADRTMLGGYSGTPPYFVTFLEGIKNKAGDNAKVKYAEGCKITEGGSWNQDSVKLADPAQNQKLIAQAVALARSADVIVLAIGGNEQTSREAWSPTHMGDRTNLQLVGDQQELFNELAALNKPIVTVLSNGRPLAVTEIADKTDALLECWYLGQESGNAVADVIFGDYNPGGKLAMTFPRSVGQIPCFYNHKPFARRGYLFDDVSPLFPFGFGFSYSTFEFKNLKAARDHFKKDESVKVTIEVTNTSDRAGDEVVQLYIRDMVSSVTRPVKELKDFKRVHFAPDETKVVEFEIKPDKLAFYDINKNYVVEPGTFRIMIGSSSLDKDLQAVEVSVDE